MEIKYVTAILTNPSSRDSVGSCAEGWYTTSSDGIVTMVNSAGDPLRNSNGALMTHRLAPGENPVVIAKRLVLKRHRAENDDMANFNRSLSYPPSEVV